MLLLQFHEWIGPSRHCTSEQRQEGRVIERQIGLATFLPLDEAIDKLEAYRVMYRECYIYTALEFRLLSISETKVHPSRVPATIRALGEVGVQLIETIDRTVKEELAERKEWDGYVKI